MSNHIHLVVQAGDKPLSGFIQNVAFRYARWFNKKQQTSGHVFQGRYKALLVDADEYLLELVRYVHLNPIRANLVTDIADYPWSSHPAYLQKDFSWVTKDTVLRYFSDTAGKARERYCTFIAAGMHERYRKAFHVGPEDTRILGNDSFMEALNQHTQKANLYQPDIDDVIMTICDAYGISAGDLSHHGKDRLFSEARAVVAYFVAELNIQSQTALARRFKRDCSSICQARLRLLARLEHDAQLLERIDKIQRKIPISPD
jgi:hypothetical protein